MGPYWAKLRAIHSIFREQALADWAVQELENLFELAVPQQAPD